MSIEEPLGIINESFKKIIEEKNTVVAENLKNAEAINLLQNITKALTDKVNSFETAKLKVNQSYPINEKLQTKETSGIRKILLKEQKQKEAFEQDVSEDSSAEEMQELTIFIKNLVKAVNGQDEVSDLMSVVTNPPLEQLISSSNLTEKQAQSIRVMKWIAARRPEFKALGDYADKYLQTNHSVGGWATNRAIAVVDARSPKIINPNLVPGLDQTSEKKHFWQRSKPSQKGVVT